MRRVHRRQRSLALRIVMGGLLLPVSCAFALNPALDISQYAHTAWKIRDGFCQGTIVAVGQTQDGYLWLGTEFGLFQFDGVHPVLWQPPHGQQLPSTYIRSLLTARDGRLWIGTSQGLASWKDGKLTRYAEPARQTVWTLLEDRQGTVWAGGHFAASAAKLCAFQGTNVRCYGEDGSFGPHINSLYEDPAGSLWVGGVTGLWRWNPGPQAVDKSVLYSTPDQPQALIDGADGALMIAMNSGVRQFRDGKLEASPLPPAGLPFSPRAFLRDRDGTLWIGTADRGLVHVHQGRTDVFERTDGLSSNFIEQIFEDREGNIWVATLDGLDRFREFTVPTLSLKEGLSNATVKSVLAAGDGSMWLATNDGLNRWTNGSITVYRATGTDSPGAIPRQLPQDGLPDNSIESLFEDYRNQIWVSSHQGISVLRDGRFTRITGIPGGETHSIAGDREGNIWISQEAALVHLHNGTLAERISWAKLGSADEGRSLIADPSGGGLWIAFRHGGVAYLKNGQVQTRYTVKDGLGSGDLRDFQLDREGAFWISTEGGLSRLKDGRIATLSSANGLPCDTVNWATEDDDRSLWIYMACGLVRIPASDLAAWAAAAGGNSGPRVASTLFDISDGVRSHLNSTGYSPSVARDRDGRLWFLPWDGVSIIDPHHLPMNRFPPPVSIEQITADRKTYDAAFFAGGRSPLPPLVRDLQIDYTALSLAAPEKVRFRYKLEGRDRDWIEAGARRQAFYNDLEPARYRFRVIAGNNSGVWNESGAALDFSIASAWFQTAWFRLSCAAGLAALLVLFYQYRHRQMARQFNIRLEARVNERTRIARDFHDTLLQTFQAVIMKFSVFTIRLSDHPELRKELEKITDQARQAVAEGRDAVQGLRSSTLVANDLARAIRAAWSDLACGPTTATPPEFSVKVEGKSRDLSPLVRDEVYRIASEALHNAFHHSRATRIEVQIRYEPRQFQLLVSDDGQGIDQELLAAGGRAGHHGLPGMRERAQLVGGHLAVSSQVNSGTRIDVTVPASIAYSKSPLAHRLMSSGKLSG